MFDMLKLSNWQKELREKYAIPLRVELWNGEQLDLSPQAPKVTVKVPNPAALRHLYHPSLYTLGKAYVEGDIEVFGKVADIIEIGNALAASNAPAPAPTRKTLLDSLRGKASNHTRERDRESIQYHYDVSNDFYATWLDQNMVYTCAYFERGDEDLGTAQLKKIDLILKKIGVQPGQTLLDIGCGWGALVIRAAEKFGARCVGVTLSENQAQLARERVAQAGLLDRVEIRIQDYRDVQGQFDRITSVGMFEHVGVANLPAYFDQINRLLAPGGIVMNHGITTTDLHNGETAYGGGKFIDEYVFPEGELAHLSTVIHAMAEADLEVRDVENLRRHYARTCSIWAENFENNADKLRTLTDAKRFRIWHVYLAGCAYAFAHDRISLYQIVCGKAGSPVAELPWSRRYMYE